MASQVEQLLRDRIEQEWVPGDRLPAEHNLAADYGVSRATIRSALTALTRRGLVTRRHGVGNFVALGAGLTNNLAEAISLSEILTTDDGPATVIFDRVGVELASVDVATQLDRDPDSPILVNRKRFVDGDTTLVYVINSIPVDILDPTLVDQAVLTPSILEPLFEFLRHDAGLDLGVHLARLSAETGRQMAYPTARPDDDIALLRIDETGFDDADAPIWHSHTWFPPGSMSIELIRQRTHPTTGKGSL